MKNINKTTKTILFVSLIAAMILPFSGMIIAEVQEVNNTNQIKYGGPVTSNFTGSDYRSPDEPLPSNNISQNLEEKLDYYQQMNNTLWKYSEVRDFHQKYENVTFVKGWIPSYGGLPTVSSFLYEVVIDEQQLGNFGNETLHKVELAALLYENRTEFSIREYVTLD